jgi:autotransporter-associated beta strand protein
MLQQFLSAVRRAPTWRRLGIAAFVVIVGGNLHPAIAGPARFWLSASSAASTGPEAAAIEGVEGADRYVHIWAQPATVGVGSFDPVTNPFKTLQNLSLNLVTDTPVVDFLDDAIAVYNPQLDASNRRFEFVHDSRSGLESTASSANILAGTPDQIRGIQAFSISGGYAGIGPTCHPSDPFCTTTSDGSPAWLIASVAARTLQAFGMSNYNLRIGSNGMSHGGESSALTDVVFGFDPLGAEPTYNAFANRGTTLPGDDPDLSIEAVAATAVVELAWSGGNGLWTDTNWSPGGTTPTWTNNVVLGPELSTNTITVTGAQQANHTTVSGGRLHIDANAGLASAVTVTAGGAISGSGRVESNLALSGAVEVSALEPLLVIGAANVSGGTIGVTEGYLQTPGTVTEFFAILEAVGGIQGALSTQIGDHLGRGIYLMDIEDVEDPAAEPGRIRSIEVQLRAGIPGDYNDDGTVNAADYTVWRDTLGQTTPHSAADGNGNRAVDPGDYDVWKSHFGETLPGASASVSVGTNAAVPEPSTIVSILSGVGLLILVFSIRHAWPAGIPQRCRMYKSTWLLVLVVVAVAAWPSSSFGVTAFIDDFEVDPSADWTVNSGPADHAVDFFFDYSSIGIPLAPSSAGESTRGLRMQANQSSEIFGGFSVSPTGQSFLGDYVVTFDWWANFNGPFPVGGSGSTQLSTFGIGTAGTQAQWAGGTQDSVWFGGTGDGNSSFDWRAYSNDPANFGIGGRYPDSSGVYAAGTAPGSTNAANPYYSAFGNNSAPAAQLDLFPQQDGTTQVGSAGMEWHQVQIARNGPTATWVVDGTLIATIDLNTVTLGGSNIFLGHSDVNATSSTDPNDANLLFTLIDNVSVTSIPDPNGLIQIPAFLDASGVITHNFLSLPPGTPYSAFIDNTTGVNAPDTMLRALDPLGNQLALNDDGSAVGNGLGSAFASTVNLDGSIHLEVTGFPDFDFTGAHTQFGDYTLSLQIGDGDPEDSNVGPANGTVAVSTRYLRNSAPTVDLSLEVANDGSGKTTFTIVHQPGGGLVDTQSAVNVPIIAGLKAFSGPVAELPGDSPSGAYQSTVEVVNDLNLSDPSETVDLAIEIYDPPELTENSAAPVQAHADPLIFLANAAAGPHPGALRAGVTVTNRTVTGPGFDVAGLVEGEFIHPGESDLASATFNRFGVLNGLYSGTFSVDLEMNSEPDSFLNGAQPVPPVNWNLEYHLTTVNADSATIANGESFDNQLGVNNATTAATLIDGVAASVQTIDMQFVDNPGDGTFTIPQLATNVVDVGFTNPGDQYVLEFTYVDENISPSIAENDLRLVFFDGDDWRMATEGNSDNGAQGAFFAGSYDAYLASLSGGAPLLGAFGLDMTENRLWAVLDHASPFASGTIAFSPHVWIATDSGNWSDVANWTSATIPSSARTRVLFGGELTTSELVTVDVDATVSEIAFDSATQSFTLADDGVHQLTLAGNALIDVRAGSHTIAALVVGSDGLIKAGIGTLVLSGTNTYSGATLIEGGRLLINGTQLGGGDYVVNPGAALGGTGSIKGDLAVHGTLAPGASPGILTIDGNYTQASSGTLEIEAGGLIPGTEHDQLIVTGTATLGGRLDVPIFGTYMPAENDEITFLAASGIEGTFGAIFSPNLASVNPNLAIEVLYAPTDARIRFVAPSADVQFETEAIAANWTDAETWTAGNVPDSTNIISVQNLSGAAQQVSVTHGSAFVHQLHVTGDTETITVSIQNGSSLSATSGVTIENKGVIELDQGNLVSSTVAVEGGGRLGGNGTVVGNVVLGTTTGAQGATLSPGLSVGHLNVTGNYQQGVNGTLAIEVEGAAAGQFDTIEVSGEAELGGTLSVTLSDPLSVEAGDTVKILSAGNIAAGKVFEQVDTIGSDDLYFALNYPNVGFASGQMPATFQGLDGTFYERGDMNHDFMVNEQDIPFFALALKNRDAYFEAELPTGACICDFGQAGGDLGGGPENRPDGRFDFDDIAPFSARIGMSTSALVAAIHASSVPEPSSVVLAVLSGLAAAGFAPRRRVDQSERSFR